MIGSQFKRVEHVLLALAATLSAYILAGVLAGPDWAAAARGAVVPSLALDRTQVLVITATVGTTIAPWGLAFIQSYAVDKRLRPQDLGLERIDVIVGAVLTGVIGFFIVIACAATLHAGGRSIDDARDAAVALEPLAGAWAARLFGAGLLGAALLAVAIVPLSTAYSVAETFGTESRLDDRLGEARIFYGSYLGTMAIAAVIVLIPSVPLVPVLFLSQALNAILLVPLLFVLNRLSSDRGLMGDYVSGPAVRALAWTATAVLVTCVDRARRRHVPRKPSGFREDALRQLLRASRPGPAATPADRARSPRRSGCSGSAGGRRAHRSCAPARAAGPLRARRTRRPSAAAPSGSD